MDDEESRQEPGAKGGQSWADELAAARSALEEARRHGARSSFGPSGPAESLESTRIAYEMELAEHRSTVERLHRAELAARDVTIQHQQVRIAELEDEVSRLRTALQVLTGCSLPEAEAPR